MSTPSGGYYVYVTNFANNTVSVINQGANEVIYTLPGQYFTNPQGVATSSNGQYTFIVNESNTETRSSNSVTVIDLVSNTFSEEITGFLTPHYIALSTNNAYVTNENGIAVVDLVSAPFGITYTIDTGELSGSGFQYPMAIAITPNEETLYVTTYVNSAILSIDISQTEPVITVIDVPSATAATAQLSNVTITPDGAFAYVVDNYNNQILVIDTATNEYTSTSPIQNSSWKTKSPNNKVVASLDGPSAIAITPDGTLGYVTNENSDNIAVIEIATNIISSTIPCGVSTTSIVITPDQRWAYATTTKKTVIVIDLSSNTVVSGVSIPVGSGPNNIAVSPYPILFNNYPIIIGNNANNSLIGLNPTQNTATELVPSNPTNFPGPSILFPPTSPNSHMYVYVGSTSNEFTVIDLSVNEIPAGGSINIEYPIGIISMTPDASSAYTITNSSSTTDTDC